MSEFNPSVQQKWTPTVTSSTSMNELVHKLRLMNQANKMHQALEILIPLIEGKPEEYRDCADRAPNEWSAAKMRITSDRYAAGIQLASEALSAIGEPTC